jgi:hypothetical protein
LGLHAQAEAGRGAFAIGIGTPAIMGVMVAWLLVAGFASFTLLACSGALQLRRYSRGHVTAQLAIRGRGVYLSRTPDGNWWKVRLRPRVCAWPSEMGEPPPDSAVREPRRPLGPGPAAGAVEFDPSLGVDREQVEDAVGKRNPF